MNNKRKSSHRYPSQVFANVQSWTADTLKFQSLKMPDWIKM